MGPVVEILGLEADSVDIFMAMIAIAVVAAIIFMIDAIRSRKRLHRTLSYSCTFCAVVIVGLATYYSNPQIQAAMLERIGLLLC